MVNTIKGLIGEGQTQEAISQMAKFAAGQSDIHNAVIQISGQYSQANFSFAMGLADGAANQAAISKINYALLSLLDQMQLQGLFSGDRPSPDEEEGPRSKLLFLASNPVDMEVLQLEKEYLEIRKIFKNHRKKFIITEEFDASLDTFFEALDREKPQIIHMSGFSDEGGVFLSSKIDRTSYLVPFEFLAPAFKMLKSSAECIFFNTGYSNVFAKVVSRSIRYAIGIKGIVHDHEAITFSSGFYAALALEKDYEKAFKMGHDLVAAMPPMAPKKGDKKAEPEKPEQKFFLYQNGLCDDDTDTPDDFFVQQEPKGKEKKQ